MNQLATVKQDGLGNSVEVKRETQSTAIAARMQAQIQARYVMAMQRPRNIDGVRVKMIAECSRPGFASVSRYALPRAGKTITGWGIRFVEAMIQKMGNLDTETITIFDDAEKRILRVTVTDLETNAAFSDEITIEKTQERHTLKDNQVPIAKRSNAAGQLVYIVATTEDDLRMKQGSQASRSIRTLALRLVPGDLLEECERKVRETLRNEDARDPAEARKKLVDSFLTLGVHPEMLSEYFDGRALDTLSTDDRLELAAIFAGMRDEGLRWSEILASSPHRPVAKGEEGEKTESKAGGRVAAKVAEYRAHRKGAKDPAPAEPSTEEPST